MEHWKPGDIEWETAPAENFTGQVLFGPVRTDGSLNILAVSFSPAARTDWHYHPGGQVLHTTHGAGVIGDEKGNVAAFEEGDLLYAPPDRVHWHGAMPHAPMSHLSHTTGPPTVWVGRKVTEEEYRSAVDRVNSD